MNNRKVKSSNEEKRYGDTNIINSAVIKAMVIIQNIALLKIVDF